MGRQALLVTLLVFALSLSSCKRKPVSDLLRIQLVTEPATLDVSRIEDDSGKQVLTNVYEGLFEYDGSGNLVPRMAESYQISSDGRVYRFKLRSGARWSDGKAVTAHDFVTGFRRALARQTASKFAYHLFPIKNAQGFNRGRVSAAELGVRAEGDGELVIELERKAPYFPHLLTSNLATPLREDVLAQSGGKLDLLRAPVNGPYLIVEHKPFDRILLARNPSYWAGAAGPAQVDFKIISDDVTAANLFDQGGIDILKRVSQFELARFKGQGWVREDHYPGTYFIGFNLKKHPVSDPNLRRDIARAIDKDAVVQALGLGFSPAASWVPPELEGGYERDAGVAKSAAPTRRYPGVEVDVVFSSMQINATLMERVQRDLREKLGVTAHLHNYDWKSYVRIINTDTPPIFQVAPPEQFHDPLYFLKLLTPDNPVAPHRGWNNPRLNELVAEIESMESGPGRVAKIREAQKIGVEDDAFIVPIYHLKQFHGVSKRVQGFEVTPTGVVPLRKISLK